MADKERNKKVTRRGFVKTAGTTFGAALGFHFIPSRAWGALEKPTLAGIGAGGKGKADIGGSKAQDFRFALSLTSWMRRSFQLRRDVD